MTAIKDKVIWITGASSGIGEALVKQVAKEGGKIILSSRRKEALEAVQSAAGLTEENSLVLPLDLAQYDQMPEKVEKALAHFGRIDILINNGGISQRSLIVDTGMEVYKRLMDIDYLGTVALTKAVLPQMIKQNGGHISVVTSLMGKFASPLRSGYCGAKHALHGFFDALRLEHEKDNIKVTIFCPGYIHTNISMNAVTGDGTAQQKMDKATQNGLTPEQCAIQMLSGLKKNKMEIAIGRKEKMGILLKRFFPRLLHRIVSKSAVT